MARRRQNRLIHGSSPLRLNPQRPRRGATLADLLMGMVISTLVVALVVTNTVRYHQSHAAVASGVDASTRLRDAPSILAADLRGISAAGDTILVASDTAIDFYSVVGASVICATPRTDRVTLPPDTLQSGRVLSSFVSSPDTGDLIAVYTDSGAGSSARWGRARIVALTSPAAGVACPLAAGLLLTPDLAGASRGFELTLDHPLSSATHRGSPVRVVRRVRYSVYRGGDGKWYLGYRRCSGTCSTIQPVSGPYESRTGAPITFRYFTRSGARLTGRGPATDVARIEVVARANYLRQAALPGMPRPGPADSILAVVALRNTR